MSPKRKFRGTTDIPYVVGEGKYLPDGKRQPSLYTGPKPIRTSRTIESRFSTSTCWVCGNRIAAGDLICKAKFRNGKERWVHTACAADSSPKKDIK